MTGPLVDAAVRSVALVRLRVGLGDLLCSLPALRRLRAARADLRISLITWAEMAPVVARMGHCVDELLPFPGIEGIPERPPDPEGWAPFVAAARAREFDLALQVYGDARRPTASPPPSARACSAGSCRPGGRPARDREAAPALPGAPARGRPAPAVVRASR